MKLTLQTPGRTLLKGIEVEEVLVPGCKGALGIFPGHTNLVSELETGILKWRKPGEQQMDTAVVTWGFVEIKDQTVTVLADVSELSHEIDKGRAKTAADEAVQKLASGLDLGDFKKYQLKYSRAMARQEA